MQPDFGPEVNHPPTPVGGIKDFCSLAFIGWNLTIHPLPWVGLKIFVVWR
jgi:hypothetical protein